MYGSMMPIRGLPGATQRGHRGITTAAHEDDLAGRGWSAAASASSIYASSRRVARSATITANGLSHTALAITQSFDRRVRRAVAAEVIAPEAFHCDDFAGHEALMYGAECPVRPEHDPPAAFEGDPRDRTPDRPQAGRDSGDRWGLRTPHDTPDTSGTRPWSSRVDRREGRG